MFQNIMILDNLFSQSGYEYIRNVCLEELKKSKKEFKEMDEMKDEIDVRKYNNRFYPKNDHFLTFLMGNTLFGYEKILETAKNLQDFSWGLYNRKALTTKYEVQVTHYIENDHYGWHSDLTNGRLFNYIYYVTEPQEGGELQISNTNAIEKDEFKTKEFNIIQTIEPKKNRLVIMPSWIIHRVKPINKGNRITLNGHITM